MMKVVIVSDNPHSSLFNQIIRFREEIESVLRRRVDLISISKEAIYLGRTEKLDISGNTDMKNKLKNLIQIKNYDLYVFSLNSDNLNILFGNKGSILDFVDPCAEIFIFGAWTKLSSIQRRNIHLFRRPGVSKLTKDFKKMILSKMKILITGSPQTLSLLDKLTLKMKTISKDIVRKDSKYWCSYRSISKDSAFAYLQPQKTNIRIFPKLRHNQIPETSLTFNRMKRSGLWGKEYKHFFRICNENQIDDAARILEKALQLHKHRTEMK